MERLDSPVAAMPAARAGEGALHHRVEALEEVLGLSRDRLDPVALAEADRVLARVAARRRLSLDHTVVALAGATGSGKSTLFNALVGVELSRTGVRRPTTGTPVACAWDPEGAGPLLDRLGILPQNRFSRRGMAFDDGLDGPGLFGGSPYGRSTAPGEPEEYGLLDPMGRTGAYPGEADRAAPGLVLLDLPDHDSAAVQHRRQVDRLLELVDEAAAQGVVSGRYAAIGRAVQRRLSERKGKPIPMNIDGASAVVYAELGFPAPLARGIFCLSRSLGILAHAWEQSQQGGRNKGPIPRQYLPAYEGPAPREVPQR